MKRISIVWLIIVFLAGAGGYAIGTSHTKPRLVIAKQLANVLLKKQTSIDTEPPDKWAVIKKTFEAREEDYDFNHKEEWFLKDDTVVNVIYNIRNDEVIITCKTKNIDANVCIK